MKKLSKEGFNRARDFLASNARPLEWALFQYTFENRSKEDALSALSILQCENGGFNDLGEGGHDGQTSMATTIAFGYLEALRADTDSDMVRRGIQFFLDSYDSLNQVWPPRPNMPEPITDRLPHALGNPSAEIVGYVWNTFGPGV
jgi:hypothetical protein